MWIEPSFSALRAHTLGKKLTGEDLKVDTQLLFFSTCE